MSCNNKNKCGCEPNPCQPVQCGCPVIVKGECVKPIDAVFECSGITAGMDLNETLTAFDVFICEKFEFLAAYFAIINIGTGAQIYAGNTGTGQKKIRSISSSESITVTQNTLDIVPSVNEGWLEEQITLNESTYSIANVGNGENLYIGNTVIGNNTQFNIKTLISTTLDITTTENNEISIENPETASIPALYVNNLYIPTYSEFLAGNQKGVGSLSKPFTDTITYTTPTTYSIAPNTAIQNALDAYVGTGTALSPELSGQKIIVQNNNTGYTFTGTFSYSSLDIFLQENVNTTTNGALIDMDNAAFFDSMSSSATVTIDVNKTLQVAGTGFFNSGNTNAVDDFSTSRKINLFGDGVVYSSQNSISRYIINADTGNIGNNNSGILTFEIRCNIQADFQGIYSVGGKARVDVYSTLSSGSGIAVNTALQAFLQTGGQVRCFSGAALSFNGVTRTNGVVFTPTGGYTPVFIGINCQFGGTVTNLFNKTNTQLTSFSVTNSPSGYGLSLINIFESPNLWNVGFKDNIFASGSIDKTKADLTSANTVSSINTIGGSVIETLIMFESKASAVSAGVPTFSALMLRKVVNAVDLIADEEYQVLVSGSPTLGTAGTYFTATGSETGTGTAILWRRAVLM